MDGGIAVTSIRQFFIVKYHVAVTNYGKTKTTEEDRAAQFSLVEIGSREWRDKPGRSAL